MLLIKISLFALVAFGYLESFNTLFSIQNVKSIDWNELASKVQHSPWKKHRESTAAVYEDKDLIVSTRFGNVKGVYAPPVYGLDTSEIPQVQQKSWARAFLGIPFALPPIGSLRFSNPVAWNMTWQQAYEKDTLQADTFSPQCLQFIALPPKNLNEDCLYINVFTPPAERMKRLKGKKLPVLFWIYGGAWQFGNGGVGKVDESNLYIGSSWLKNKDFIFVTFNHRVGALGFLKTSNTKGNYGLEDIFTAAWWTHDNIGSFGGDNQDITVAGMSSGAYNTWLLAFSERAPPIKRLIPMSAPFSLKLRQPKLAEEGAKSFSQQLGCSYNDFECYKAANPLRVMYADFMSTQVSFDNPLATPMKWLPTFSPDDGFVRPLEAKLPTNRSFDLLIGVTKEESELFFRILEHLQGGSLVYIRGDRSFWESLVDLVIAWFSDAVRAAEKALGQSFNAAQRLYVQGLNNLFGKQKMLEVLLVYPPKLTLEENVQSMKDIFTDYMFTCPARKLAMNVASSSGTRVYVYEQHQGPKWSESFMKGAAHAFDLSYLFNFYPQLTEDDIPMSYLYQDYFAGFIAGDINTHDMPNELYGSGSQKTLVFQSQVADRRKHLFEKFNATSRYVMNFGEEERNVATMKQGLHEQRCNFWENFRTDGSEIAYPY